MLVQVDQDFPRSYFITASFLVPPRGEGTLFLSPPYWSWVEADSSFHLSSVPIDSAVVLELLSYLGAVRGTGVAAAVESLLEFINKEYLC